MNSSPFMDKQILGLSGVSSSGGGDIFDLIAPTEERQIDRSSGAGDVMKEEIVPSYDFQPIRTLGSKPLINSGGGGGIDGGRSSWGSVDSKLASAATKYTDVSDHGELPKFNHEKEKSPYDLTTVAEIDRTVKKYADHLLHALDGMSSRLSQMESRTRNLENAVDELKLTVGNNSGSTDGKLRQLENILREVQTGIQVLRDKQDIADAQMQLAKLKASKGENFLSEPTSQTGQQLESQNLQQQHTLQQALPPPLPAPPVPNAPLPPQQQIVPQLPNQYSSQFQQTQLPPPPSLQQDSYVPQHATPLPSEPAPPLPQYQISAQKPQLQQQYQSPPLPQFSQPSLPQPVNPSLQPPVPHHPEESGPYMLGPQSYPPPPLPSQIPQPPSGSSTPQQLYSANPVLYEPPPYRPTTGQLSYSTGYASSEPPYPYSGSPSHYNSPVKPSPGGSGSYPRLPTAQLLPQAQPVGPSSSVSPGNRVPIDDVVDKVATMGFSREQVRATVRKLTENGQSVDLNVVLDKLMNDGEIQPQKGWFGR